MLTYHNSSTAGSAQLCSAAYFSNSRCNAIYLWRGNAKIFQIRLCLVYYFSYGWHVFFLQSLKHNRNHFSYVLNPLVSIGFFQVSNHLNQFARIFCWRSCVNKSEILKLWYVKRLYYIRRTFLEPYKFSKTTARIIATAGRAVDYLLHFECYIIDFINRKVLAKLSCYSLSKSSSQ